MAKRGKKGGAISGPNEKFLDAPKSNLTPHVENPGSEAFKGKGAHPNVREKRKRAGKAAQGPKNPDSI